MKDYAFYDLEGGMNEAAKQCQDIINKVNSEMKKI